MYLIKIIRIKDSEILLEDYFSHSNFIYTLDFLKDSKIEIGLDEEFTEVLSATIYLAQIDIERFTILNEIRNLKINKLLNND